MIMKTETLNWITAEIENTKGLVRAKKTKEKYIGFVNLISEFTEDNQCFTKKELTQMVNSLDKVCSTYYGLKRGDELRGDSGDLIFDKLAQKRGFKDTASMYGSDDNSPIRTLLFISVYYMSNVSHAVKCLSEYKLNTAEKAFVTKFYPNMDKWADIVNTVKIIRDIQNPTKEQKELKKLNEIKGRVNPNLKVAIDEIAENFRQVIEENQLSYYNRVIVDFKKECPLGVTSSMFRSKTIKADYQNILRLYLVRDKNNVQTLSSDYEVKLAKEVYDYSVNVITSWQIKMYDKLGGDFIGVDDKFTTSVSGSRYTYNDIVFDFDNGSCFTLRNQLVSKISNRGTFFYTYPTTFHDAYLPDGVAVKFPDEYTVKKAFQEYYGNN